VYERDAEITGRDDLFFVSTRVAHLMDSQREGRGEGGRKGNQRMARDGTPLKLWWITISGFDHKRRRGTRKAPASWERRDWILMIAHKMDIAMGGGWGGDST